MFDDKYKEIKLSATGVYKEKGSRFISYSYPVYSEKDVKEKLEEIKKKEHAARHHCYAFVLNPDKSAQRSNDDGEPSSTAGKPILRQILSNDLTNILIIVARYFGGIKLGIPGLIRSYKTAAADVISKSIIITKIIKESYEVTFEYTQMNNVMLMVKKYNLKVINTDFNINCKLIFTIKRSQSNDIIDDFKKNHKLIIKYLKTVS